MKECASHSPQDSCPQRLGWSPQGGPGLRGTTQTRQRGLAAGSDGAAHGAHSRLHLSTLLLK